MVGRTTDTSSVLSIIRSIQSSSKSMFSSLEKLSSGYRLNRASDGPADLIISEHFKTQIASLNKEIENYQNNIGKYETASSYVSTLRSNLTEMRSLAIAAANEGFNSSGMQQAYATEALQLAGQFNDIVLKSEYNGLPMFGGTANAVAEIEQFDLSNIDLSSASSSNDFITYLDQQISAIDSKQIEIGATIKDKFQSELQLKYITLENLTAAEAQINSTDYALEISKFMIERVQLQASMALLSHSYISSRTMLELLQGADR